MTTYVSVLTSIFSNLNTILSQPMVFFPWTWKQFIFGMIVANIVISITRWILGIGANVEMSHYFRTNIRNREANSKKIKVSANRRGDTH